MKHIIPLLLSLVLSACGGGGGGGGPPATSNASTTSATNFVCTSPGSVPTNKYRAGAIDLRNDGSASSQTNSLANVKPFIDRIKCNGFDTVVLQTNIPIDTSTGQINTTHSTAQLGSQDKSLPRDFWSIASYAKTAGLKVIVKAIPVDYTNDNIIMMTSLNSDNIIINQFFSSLKTYEKTLAAQAQSVGVDAFYVGVFQIGLDGAQYANNWLDVINQVKSVYSGKLIYSSCYYCSNSVWANVDFISVDLDPTLASTAVNDLATLVGLYTHIADGTNIVSTITNLRQTYNKLVILDSIRIDAMPNSMGDSTTFDSAILGQLPAAIPDYTLQSRRMQAVFELSATSLNGVTAGIVFGEYLPWAQELITDNTTSQWNLFDRLGFSMYNNLSAFNTLKQYLSQSWNYHTL